MKTNLNFSSLTIFILLNFLYLSCLQTHAIPFKHRLSSKPNHYNHHHDSFLETTIHPERMKLLTHDSQQKEFDQVQHSTEFIPSRDQINHNTHQYGTKSGLMYHLMRFFGLGLSHEEKTVQEDTEETEHHIPMPSLTSSVTLSDNIKQEEGEDIEEIEINNNQIVNEGDNMLLDTELWDMVHTLKKMFTKIEMILDERIQSSTEEVPDVTRALEEARKLNVKRDRERDLRERDPDNDDLTSNLEIFGKDDLLPISAPAYGSKRSRTYENERINIRKSADVDDD